MTILKSIGKKLLAALLSPFLLMFVLFAYNLFHQGVQSLSFSAIFNAYAIIYFIFAWPMYISLAIPAAFLIERIRFGFQWVYYMTAGVVAFVFIGVVNSAINRDRYLELGLGLGDVFFASMAGLAFYFSIKIIDRISRAITRRGNRTTVHHYLV
ncbi:hypothetical protein ACE1TF_07050 [Geomicrobium sp. JSM 1781026]|uniref:hypothetical protein n=1 Tax=Geomicrobium sp. JSM 1781026 TaxID=3344580 RepID=UPI0035C1C439